MKRLLSSMLVVAATLAPGLALAAEFQPIETIRQSAMAAVPGFGSPGVEVEAVVDSALRLPACGLPLQAQPAAAGTMEVVCPGNSGWRLYVPIKQRRLQQVLVLQRPLARGEAITADALALEQRDVARSPGALVDANVVQGYSLRRPLTAGAVLTSADVISPRLVRRGDSVTLVARAGGIEVRAQARAMADAGAGERVNVENLSSRRLLQGVVLASGEVEVGH